MRTLEIEVALIQYFNPRQKIIVPNVYWGIPGLNYECDLVVVTQSGYATEIEIKTSKNDLHRDKKKRHGHKSKLFKYFYFAVPKEMVEYAQSNIPEQAGLLCINKNIKSTSFSYTVKIVKNARYNNKCIRWDSYRMSKLNRLGTMRILGLKQAILALSHISDSEIL